MAPGRGTLASTVRVRLRHSEQSGRCPRPHPLQDVGGDARRGGGRCAGTTHPWLHLQWRRQPAATGPRGGGEEGETGGWHLPWGSERRCRSAAASGYGLLATALLVFTRSSCCPLHHPQFKIIDYGLSKMSPKLAVAAGGREARVRAAHGPPPATCTAAPCCPALAPAVLLGAALGSNCGSLLSPSCRRRWRACRRFSGRATELCSRARARWAGRRHGWGVVDHCHRRRWHPSLPCVEGHSAAAIIPICPAATDCCSPDPFLHT